MPVQPYHAKADEVPRVHQSRFGGRLSRTAFVSENTLFTFIWLDGVSGDTPVDQHPFDQWVYVLEGSFEMVLEDDDVYVLEPGDVLYVPSNVRHRPRFPNPGPIAVFEAFSPIRLDLLYTAEHQLTANAAPRQPDGSRVDDVATDASSVHAG